MIPHPLWLFFPVILVSVLVAACLLSAFLILALKPLLVRYALARPNARSSHKAPTPQGGGIAVVGAALIMALASMMIIERLAPADFLAVVAATVVLACMGAVDDIRPLPAGLRLVLQIAVVSIVITTSEIRLFSQWVPQGVEHAILILGGVWFVNLVNFMDGLDWITVTEMVPITAFFPLVVIASLNLTVINGLPSEVVWTSTALCGALLGFAPFNKPVARLFLGDVGSLPIGLLVGWMLLQLAGTGALAAAILLPLYYLMDATITLLRRFARGEKVWEAHRSHFYQKATDNGFSVLQVNAHVFGLNLVLAGFAAMTLVWPSGAVQIAALVAGIFLVGLVLRRFSRPHPEVSR